MNKVSPKTIDNKSPEEIFKKDDRETLYFLIGIPGSGKSTWANIAKNRGYNILNADEIRRKHLVKLA